MFTKKDYENFKGVFKEKGQPLSTSQLSILRSLISKPTLPEVVQEEQPDMSKGFQGSRKIKDCISPTRVRPPTEQESQNSKRAARVFTPQDSAAGDRMRKNA